MNVTMDSADDGLLRTGPMPGLPVNRLGGELHFRVGDEVGRYRLVGSEGDGSVLLWQHLGHDR